MMGAMERLRAAFDACLNTGLPPAAYDLYCEVRELLKAHPGPVAGSWSWAVEQMRQGRKVRRRGWGDREQYVYADGDWITESALGGRNWSATFQQLDATDWELLQPAHKPCPAGHKASIGGQTGRWFVCCEEGGMCWMGPTCETQAEAWEAWDGREGGAK